MTPDELKARAKRFAVDVIRLYRAVPRTDGGRVIGSRLVRTGTVDGSAYCWNCSSKVS